VRRLLLWIWAGWASGCVGGTPSPAPEESTRPPDVLLVILDTVREDATFGARRPGVTPQLEALAAQGARFTDVTAPGSWTWPSHTSLFTGTHPREHGAHFAPPEAGGLVLGERAWSVGAFPEHLPTLAERLQEAGYRTVSLSENPLIGPDLGSTRGFAVAETQPADSGMSWILDRVAAELGQTDDRPLFLFVNLLDAHHPWAVAPVGWLEPHASTLAPATAPDWLRPYLRTDGDPVVVDLLRPAAPGGPSGEIAFHTGTWSPPPEAAALFRDLYDASVYRADYKLHRLLQAWGGTGRSGVVAVTSDHGELLGEHDAFFHGRSVWPELTRVPLVLVADGIPPGTTVDAPVQMHDLHDTVLELTGVATGPRSLVPVATGSGAAPSGPIQAQAWPDQGFGDAVGGAYQHGWRLHREDHFAVVVGTDGSTAMYDLSTDPGMVVNLLASDPARLGSAAPLIKAARAWTEHPVTRAADASPETVEALQALGYVDRPEGTAKD